MLAGLRFALVREPVGVGSLTHIALLSQYGGLMLLAIALSTWIGLAGTALVLFWPDRKKAGA